MGRSRSGRGQDSRERKSRSNGGRLGDRPGGRDSRRSDDRRQDERRPDERRDDRRGERYGERRDDRRGERPAPPRRSRDRRGDRRSDSRCDGRGEDRRESERRADDRRYEDPRGERRMGGSAGRGGDNRRSDSRSSSGSPSPPKSLRDRAAEVLTKYRETQRAALAKAEAEAKEEAEKRKMKADAELRKAKAIAEEYVNAEENPPVMTCAPEPVPAAAVDDSPMVPDHLARLQALEARLASTSSTTAAAKKAVEEEALLNLPEPVHPIESEAQREKREAAEPKEDFCCEICGAPFPTYEDAEVHEVACKRKRKAEATEAEETRRNKKKKGPPAGAQSAAFDLYGKLPAPDPVKDAEAKVKGEAASAAELARMPVKIDFSNYRADSSKVIFLDIDGVLRPIYGNFQIASMMMDGEILPVIAEDGTEFVTTAMNALRHILLETGAVIVLSSEWRRHNMLRDGVNLTFKAHGLPRIVMDTPKHEMIRSGNPLRTFAFRRVREINEWLHGHPDVKDWVILDDIDLSVADEKREPGTCAITPRFVHTDKTACLTLEDAKTAIDMLNRKSDKGG